MIIYMTLETDDGEYELEIEATGHINPPNLFADSREDFYGEVLINWEIISGGRLHADFDFSTLTMEDEEIEELSKDYYHDINEHVINEVMKAQGSGEE